MVKAKGFLKYWQGLFGGLRKQDIKDMKRERSRDKIGGIGIWVLVAFVFAFSLLNASILNAQQLQLNKVRALIGGKPTNGGYFSPIWSPDGKKIAVTKSRYKGIYVINIEGNGLKTITEDEGAGFRFVWSPDSEEILYRSRKFKNDGLIKYILRSAEITSGKITDLTAELEWVSLPIYSKTKGIMYSYNSKLKQRRKRVDTRAMGKIIGSEISVADNVSANAIVEIPSRDKVVIEDNEGIKIMDSTGKIEKIIIKHGQNDFAVDAKPSPDGKKIMFFNNVGSIGHLYVYDLDTEKITDLGEGYFGQWLPDSRIIYCITTNDGYILTSSEIYLINADGTGKMKITETTDQIEIQPSVSPDGKSIVYRDDKSGMIYLGILEIL